MTYVTDRSSTAPSSLASVPFASRMSVSFRRAGLSADEVAVRRLRRRLLRFILENHRRREAERGLSQQPLAGRQ
ncbi:hypothetical protein Pla108_06330 [Botrimarina colliarenosi]|uniref:Uncharacterized protein n=1 Tax=Botrimarina colliarenosi TaxID=2528001 RepID=A0A5C6AJU8_9BACT|nr:hypothetical protein [Botrimarina colliarenosi]TWT99690.1 hypothetical protein Pla108_06330 [Botrimarina colliarenosi]